MRSPPARPPASRHMTRTPSSATYVVRSPRRLPLQAAHNVRPRRDLLRVVRAPPEHHERAVVERLGRVRRPRLVALHRLADVPPRRAVPREATSGWSREASGVCGVVRRRGASGSKPGDGGRGVTNERRERKSFLRNGVHHANAVVWEPV
eukprot:30401-Pelagococcus_subviridis.AAC.4